MADLEGLALLEKQIVLLLYKGFDYILESLHTMDYRHSLGWWSQSLSQTSIHKLQMQILRPLPTPESGPEEVAQ